MVSRTNVFLGCLVEAAERAGAFRMVLECGVIVRLTVRGALLRRRAHEAEPGPEQRNQRGIVVRKECRSPVQCRRVDDSERKSQKAAEQTPKITVDGVAYLSSHPA